MINIKKFNFLGGRIIKTGIAVFLTALICQSIGWPYMLAVITAIVTIEPTAADSIKKAFIRFPASAIGAAFAMLYTFLLGVTPLTYMLVAVSTIISCYKLRLHAGTLVATLTGVAMLTIVHDHYFISFLIRLATTSIGLLTSSLVNIIVLPPNYTPIITRKIQNLSKQMSSVLQQRGSELSQVHVCHKQTKLQFQQLSAEIEKIETLCEYQRKEWKFHHFTRTAMRKFHYEYKKLSLMRQLVYHIGNLIYLPAHQLQSARHQVIWDTFTSFHNVLQNEQYKSSFQHQTLILTLKQRFWAHKQEENRMDQPFSTETTMLYELLAIHHLLEELHRIHLLKERYNLNNSPVSLSS